MGASDAVPPDQGEACAISGRETAQEPRSLALEDAQVVMSGSMATEDAKKGGAFVAQGAVTLSRANLTATWAALCQNSRDVVVTSSVKVELSSSAPGRCSHKFCTA